MKLRINKSKRPVAKQIPFMRVAHGHKRLDPFQWMEDRDDEVVLEYLHQENNYTKAVLQETETLQEELVAEMKSRMQESEDSTPYPIGDYQYFRKYEKGSEYTDLWRFPSHEPSSKQKLLDGTSLAGDSPYFQLGGWDLSEDQQHLLFAIDKVGRRNYQLFIKNLKTGQLINTGIEDAEGGSFVWGRSYKDFFYLKRNSQTLLAETVMKVSLDDDFRAEEVYKEKDDQFYLNLSKTIEGDYLKLLASHNGLTSEVLLLDLRKEGSTFESFSPRQKGHEYDIEYAENTFWIKSNKEKSSVFHLYKFTKEDSDWELWWEASSEGLLESFHINEDVVALEWRSKGDTTLFIINKSTKEQSEIPFEANCKTVALAQNYNYSENRLRLVFTSLNLPLTYYDYDVKTAELIFINQKKVRGAYEATDYHSERRFATARDHEVIPISIIRHKDTPLNGTAPLLLYAYGSYGLSMDPYFSTHRLSLLNRGFIFAIAHVRGGQEMGRNWYVKGKLFHKINTFTDFLDVASYCVNHGLCSAQKLFANGGSAGGLLMGAIANMKPSLFRGIIADVPFVDVVSTMLDDTIPLTTGEYEEWGNPSVFEAYEYMLRYSPYDNVKEAAYPNMLITSGYHDSQVQYWEPTKWLAKLRLHDTGESALLLSTEMNAGHGGASGRYKSLIQLAMKYAFLIASLSTNSGSKTK